MVAVTAVGLVGLAAVPAQAALPTGPTTTGVTGSRPSATNLSFPISDRVAAQVDVATGNLLVSTAGLSLTGVNSSVQIGQVYNSLGFQTGSTSTPAANGWSYNLDGAGSLAINGTNPVYVGPDGSTWQFTPVAGSTTAYMSPAGLAKTLTHDTTPNTFTLTDLMSRQVVVYDSNGNPTKVTDKNGNAVTTTFTSGSPTSVATTAGPSASRTAAFSYNPSLLLWTISQTNGTHTRSIAYQKDSASNLTSFKDANGKTTTFGYTSGHLTKIISTTGAETDFSYDSTGKIAEIDQLNTTTGSPGTSTTRLTYPSGTQTLVAGPNTNPAVAVATGPHTTYAINSTQELVNSATDPLGRQRSKTYNANALPLTASSGASGAAGSTTTTAQYNANNNQSLTSVSAQGGTSSTATYSNTNPATAFLPQSTTSDSGSGSSTTQLTYDGPGNQLSSSTGTGATLAQATLTRNTDGTVATALAPGNGTNTTAYGYNGDHQLTSTTPPTGTTLATKAFTYDWFGRLATETDGAGNTTNYTYDNNDRLLTTAFSDSTGTVTNTYDDAGHLLTQASTPGTITNTYDQLGRLTSTVNTAGGGTISYGYDQASNETSTTTTYGTWTNTFDTSGVLTQTKYPKGTSFAYTDYGTDNQGRRTDTWLQANATYTNGTPPTSWTGHQQTSFDANGRVSEIQASTNSTSPTTVFDTTYCYNSASTSSCATGTTTDHPKIQSSKNILTGQLTQYTYDGSGRLLTAAQSGGSAGNTTYTYTYDLRGNRLTATTSGSTTSSQTLTYNAANQITTTGYSYDGAGNLTTTPTARYTYNAAEQMTTSKNLSSGVVTGYTYAGSAQNKVLSEATAGGQTYNLSYGQNDAQGQPEIVQYNLAASSLTGNVFSDPTTGQPLMLTTSSNIATLYVTDGLSNPVGLLVDFNGNAATSNYDPYGVGALTGSGNGASQNPYTFHGGIQDRASGLVKFGIRWYNPITGTWTQQDTLDAPLDPGNANRYVFTGGDPINGLDPTGHGCGTDIANAIGNSLLALGIIGAALFAAPETLGGSIALGASIAGGLIVAGASDYQLATGDCSK
jgi:RHS repeat-associated protein